MNHTLSEAEWIKSGFMLSVTFKKLDSLLCEKKHPLPKDWYQETVGEYALRVTGADFEVI